MYFNRNHQRHSRHFATPGRPARSHIGAVAVPARQVCVGTLLSATQSCALPKLACVSVSAQRSPSKAIYFPEASGPLNAAVPQPRRKRRRHNRRHNRRNNHKQRICALSSPSSHSSAGKRSSQMVHMHERRGSRGREKLQKNAADYNQSATTEFALGGAESMGQYWAASFPPRAAFASV